MRRDGRASILPIVGSTIGIKSNVCNEQRGPDRTLKRVCAGLIARQRRCTHQRINRAAWHAWERRYWIVVCRGPTGGFDNDAADTERERVLIRVPYLERIGWTCKIRTEPR